VRLQAGLIVQLARAAHQLETLLRARGHGRNIEQVDAELGDARTGIFYVYVVGDDEPMTIVIDFEQPMTEQEFEAQRPVLLAGLLSLMPVSPTH